jgi:hypothetical protein
MGEVYRARDGKLNRDSREQRVGLDDLSRTLRDACEFLATGSGVNTNTGEEWLCKNPSHNCYSGKPTFMRIAFSRGSPRRNAKSGSMSSLPIRPGPVGAI